MDYFLKVVTVGDMQENCVLIGNPETKELVIIDPGAEANRLKEEIKASGYKPVAILLTHGHFDHIGAVTELCLTYNVKVYAGEDEKELLSDPELNLSRGNGPEIKMSAGEWLTDEQVLVLGGMYITVLKTPGHTSGSISLFFPLWRLLVDGDLLFFESVGRTDFPTGDYQTLVDVIIDKLFGVLPLDTVVIPGHGPATSLEYEKRNNPYIAPEIAHRIQEMKRAGTYKKDDEGSSLNIKKTLKGDIKW